MDSALGLTPSRVGTCQARVLIRGYDLSGHFNTTALVPPSQTISKYPACDLEEAHKSSLADALQDLEK